MMRRAIFSSVVSFAFLPAFAVIASAQNATSTGHVSPNLQCTQAVGVTDGAQPMACGGGDVGGGGGGGGVRTSPTPVTSWGSFVRNAQVNYSAGGISQRYGVSTVVANTVLYVARTDTTIVDSAGEAPIYVSTSGTGVGYGIDSGRRVNMDAGSTGVVLAVSNPAISADANGNLYLAWINGQGQLNFVTSVQPPSTPELVDWGTTVYTFSASNGGLIYSPSIAVNTVNGISTVYISALSGADRSLWLGHFQVGQPYGATWTNFPADNDIGMSPGLATFNNTLYIGYPAYDSHNLYYYTTTDGVNLTFQTGASGDQSSTTASLLAYNGLLYMGFRTNDGDHKFIYKYSSDGVNWSGNISLSGVTMGGPPSLADGTHLNGDPGHLINTYVANDSTQYIYSGESQ